MHKNVFNRTQDTVCYAGVKNIIKGEMENEREQKTYYTGIGTCGGDSCCCGGSYMRASNA